MNTTLGADHEYKEKRLRRMLLAVGQHCDCFFFGLILNNSCVTSLRQLISSSDLLNKEGANLTTYSWVLTGLLKDKTFSTGI